MRINKNIHDYIFTPFHARSKLSAINYYVSTLMDFPTDDNGQILAEMHQEGVDLTKTHTLDFFILFEKIGDADKFAKVISEDDLAPNTKQQKCPDTGVFEVLVSVEMVPDHQLITDLENYLESVANPLNGYGDGWGILAE